MAHSDSKREQQKVSRRHWLRSTALMVAAGAAAPLVFVGNAEAASKMAKTAVDYQDHPKGKEMCSNCRLFIPGANPKAPGECKAVAGSISPEGWCNIYIPKA